MERIAADTYVSTDYSGVTVGFIAGPRGAVAVDAPLLPSDARAWREEVTEVAGVPIVYVVLTDVHPDRLYSAGLLGAPIVTAREGYERAAAYSEGFWRTAIEAWSQRFPEAADDLADVSVRLPEVLFTDRVTLRKGGADVMVERAAAGTPESAWIHLRERDVLFVGDTVVRGVHPFLSAATDTRAWLKTLRTLRRERFSGIKLVPGRGSVCGPSATRPVSDYIALVRRRARSMHIREYSRAEKTAVVAELMEQFPVPEGERESVQRRVRAGLDRVYEELAEE